MTKQLKGNSLNFKFFHMLDAYHHHTYMQVQVAGPKQLSGYPAQEFQMDS